MANDKTKLELTSIGEENIPWLGLPSLDEFQAQSDLARTRV